MHSEGESSEEYMNVKKKKKKKLQELKELSLEFVSDIIVRVDSVPVAGSDDHEY